MAGKQVRNMILPLLRFKQRQVVRVATAKTGADLAALTAHLALRDSVHVSHLHTRTFSKSPCSSSAWQTGMEQTPVASIATWVTPSEDSHLAASASTP
jgi:hypothetical protein